MSETLENEEVIASSLDDETADVADSLNKQGLIYYGQDNYEQAEPLYRRALLIRERLLGPEHPDTASSLNNLANLYFCQGRYVKAEPLYIRVLLIRERLLGPRHPDTMIIRTNYQLLLRHRG
jgi:tetratricopeptide (TPR) repeat protein